MMYYAKPIIGETGTYAYHIAECHRLWDDFFQSRSAALEIFCRYAGITLAEFEQKGKQAVLFHDAGKLLPTFQQQMEHLIEYHKANPVLHFRHELASALLLLIIDRKNLVTRTNFPYDVLAVLGHHKVLGSDWNSFIREKNVLVPPGLDAEGIKEILAAAIAHNLTVDVDLQVTAKNFQSSQWVKRLLINLRELLKPSRIEQYPVQERKKIRLVYAVTKGLLMTCDWLASIDKEEERIPVNHEMTNNILRRKIKEKVEKENRVYEQLPFHTSCERQLQHVLAIAPTGAGKTEAALLWATNKSSAKIIFLMPTMVTSNSLYTRMVQHYFKKNECGLVHSGADIFFAQQNELNADNTNKDFRMMFYRYKAFLAPVMVSTVDQILTSGFNIGLWCQKEWALVGSKVIFDEIHAYQPFTLGLITALIEKIINLGGHVCIMSATMPAFLRDHFKSVLQISAPLVATELMSRKKCCWQYRNINIETMRDEILAYLKAGKKVAIVFNTVRAAQQEFRIWRELWPEDKVLCYHSQFVMKDRQDKEDWLLEKNDLNRDHYNLVIATQAIEVSLDISFDVMYSECAPLDSLIQRAGRCNRNNRSGEYYFIVFPISSIAYDHVYSHVRIEIDRTIEVLVKNQTYLREDELASMLEYVYQDSSLGIDNADFLEGYQLYDSIAAAIDGQGFIFDLSVNNEETVTRKIEYVKVNIIPYCFRAEVEKLWEERKYSLIRRYEVAINKERWRKSKWNKNFMELPIYEVPYTVEEGVIDSEDDLPTRFI